MSAARVTKAIQSLASPTQARHLQRFFKTSKGEYGYGDVFLGITVPQIRKIANEYKDLTLPQIDKLMASKFHEVRFCGLVILTLQFKSSSESIVHKKIFDFYLKQVKAERVNNWDLVDVSAPIIGQYLIGLGSSNQLLLKLARSKSLWQRRVAIVFTFAFIREGIPQPTLLVAQVLLRDEQDLIHKATGWMLREMGKRNPIELRKFLERHVSVMPRTMLRYAIEKFSSTERKRWLAKYSVITQQSK
jgi:3-methyladenine DNA glycosylase AlkD